MPFGTWNLIHFTMEIRNAFRQNHNARPPSPPPPPYTAFEWKLHNVLLHLESGERIWIIESLDNVSPTTTMSNPVPALPRKDKDLWEKRNFTRVLFLFFTSLYIFSTINAFSNLNLSRTEAFAPLFLGLVVPHLLKLSERAFVSTPAQRLTWIVWYITIELG